MPASPSSLGRDTWRRLQPTPRRSPTGGLDYDNYVNHYQIKLAGSMPWLTVARPEGVKS